MSRPRFKILDDQSIDPQSLFDTIAEPENRATTIGTPLILDLITNQYRNGITSLSMVKESIGMLCFGFAFQPFSPFYDTLNRKVMHLIESGITDYWIIKHNFGRSLFKIEEIGPQVLTMEHLEVGFIVSIAPLFISLLSFFLEITVHQFKKFLDKSKKKNSPFPQ